MKSLTILHTEYSDGWGGQEIRIVDEAQGIAERGHRVIIVARPECKILPRAKAAGLETRELPMRHAFDWRAIRQLRSLVRVEKPDIVNTHSSIDSWIGAWAVKMTGAKLVRTRHLSSVLPRHPLNVIYRLPDAVVTTGEAVREQLIAARLVRADRVVSIPTGVDVDRFSPRPADLLAKRALGLPEACQVVSIVAVLRRFKRHDVFVQTAGILSAQDAALRFLIAGEGPGRKRIERYLVENKVTDRAVLTGHLEDVRPVLSFSDVVVLCSDTGEGVPQSLGQAMALARPVVGTTIGGIPELVLDQITGLLVPAGDPKALADALTRFLGNPAFAAACAARGREHVVKNHSRDKMVAQTLALYERLTRAG